MSRYIDAEDLKMELIGWETEPTDEDIERVIDNMPTADVAPVVHGRWLQIMNGVGVCSNCYQLDEVDPLATNCRFCGARMDGEDGETDGTI